MTGRLASLVFPADPKTFIEQYWPKKPYAVHGLDKTIASIRALPFLQSLDDLLNSWPNLVQVHLPDVADESSAVDVTPKDARQMFSNKMGLLFNHVQSISPELVGFLSDLKSELGLPASTLSRCMVYATPSGKGTAAHFDQNVNFVLQLHGTKRWWLAPNENFENPTERHVIGQPLDIELASFAEGELPESMPTKNRTEVVLKPGSMLFVPRGYWHSTEAEGEALALNFTFNQPTWIDLFSAALRSRLTLSPEWRELADGVNSTEPALRKNAQANFDLLLAELVEDLPNWTAEEILAATEGV
jgi:50S ribosomal protein L16 3-hydroxylase